MEMPFTDTFLDGAILNGSLHEWEYPARTFGEIQRVLKADGIFCICNLRRNISFFAKQMMYRSVKPTEIRQGFISSLNASYTGPELEEIVRKSPFDNFSVTEQFSGLCIQGKK